MARRILIADGTVNNRIAFKAALSAARYEVSAVASATEAVTALEEFGADLVMIDAALPDLAASGLAERLASRDPMAPPCIVVTDQDDSERRAAWIEAGAAAVMARPIERSWLLTNLRGILRRHESRVELARQVATARRLGFAEDASAFVGAPHISVVANDRTAAGRLVRGLPNRIGYPVASHSPGEILANAAAGTAIDLIILTDDDLEETLWLLSELRAHPTTRRASILVEYDTDDRQRGGRALDLGANALLRTDAGLHERGALIMRELAAKRRADDLRRHLDQSLRLAARDELTGLFNRRYAMQYLADTARRSCHSERSYGVLLVDIDHFKQVNDRLGHATGDTVLRQVALRLRDNLREHDLVARYGGEEFLVILSDAKPAEALMAAERLREAVETSAFQARQDAEEKLDISISVGVACATTEDTDEILSRADAALYRAKRDGRNLSRLACDDEVPPIASISGPARTMRATG